MLIFVITVFVITVNFKIPKKNLYSCLVGFISLGKLYLYMIILLFSHLDIEFTRQGSVS